MIDVNILDKIIPIPTEEEKLDEVKNTLAASGFPIDNFNKGGIMYGFILIIIQIYREMLYLSRTIVHSCFAKHASGNWLDIKSADFGKSRKDALKAQGYVTVIRSNYSNALAIYKGHGFKTMQDTNGVEKKFYCVEDTVLKAGEAVGKVLVEAEEIGTSYNLPENKIVVSMINLEGVESITNVEGWLYREASDKETDDALRERDINSYSELAEKTTRGKLKSIAENVEGVVNATINDQHPRGQGTTDIIITGSAGEATEDLIMKVSAAIENLKGSYDDYLVKSSEVEYQDFILTIYLAENSNTEGVKEQATELIEDMITMDRTELNVLYRDSIIAVLSKNIESYRKTDIVVPNTDLELDSNHVIMLGTISVTVTTV